MTTSIKITQLNSIGAANIAFTSLVPVVNMAGTPETQKATLQLVGNLILTGAGGTNFPPANTALLSQTVSNAAQPNITSVGNLTTLVVTGNATTGNLNGGNLVSANFFSGDGGLLSNISVSSGTLTSGNSTLVVNEDGDIRMSPSGTSNVVIVNTDGVVVDGAVVAQIIKTNPVAVGSLPDAEIAGAGSRAFVTDASDNSFGVIATGGGANIVPVFSDGTNWLIG